MGPALIEDRTAGGTGRVFIARRHDIVREILATDTIFSLRHYDDRLDQIANGARYFVSDDQPGRDRRLVKLAAAQAYVEKLIGAGPIPRGAPYLDWIAAIARDEAQRAAAILHQRQGPPQPFNFIRDYVFIVTYRAAARVFGVAMPERMPLLVLIYMLLRTLVADRSWPHPSGQSTAATTLVALMHAPFGFVFNPGRNSNYILKLIARASAEKCLSIINSAIDRPDLAPPASLLAALLADAPPPAGQDRADIRSILFEFAGAIGLIASRTTADIAALLTKPEAASSVGIDWATVAARLRTSTAGDSHAIMNELVRLTANTKLSRTVRTGVDFHGIALDADDWIILDIAAASRDPHVFASPDRFNPDPARPIIAFGPTDGKHACYGQFIARTLIREMILVADEWFEPCPGTALEVLGELPDAMAWRCRPQRRDFICATEVARASAAF
ncbi:MAG: cytochrome P450 [Sandarakinorhabdus sp.]|nr:cytochrome P450 [Sandarakinorhabdus sp.]